MLRCYQIEHLHFVALLSKEFCSVGIQLAFGVGEYDRLVSLYRLKQRIAYNGAGFHGTGCTEHCNVSVESGILWHTDRFSLVLTEDDALRFFNGCYLQFFLHLLVAHPCGGAVDAVLAFGKSSRVILLAVELVVQFYVQENGAADHQKPEHALESARRERLRKADDWVPVDAFDGGFACKTACFHPFTVVGKQLSGDASDIEHRRKAQYDSKDNANRSFLVGQFYSSCFRPSSASTESMPMVLILTLGPRYSRRKGTWSG